MSGTDALVSVMESDAPSGDGVEVHQVWGSLLVDVREFPSDRQVSIGSSPAWRWSLLGVDMGRVSALAARALPWLLPVWSDVSAGTKADFAVPSVDLPGDADHVLVRDGVVQVARGWDGFVDRDGQRYPFAGLPDARPTPEGGWEVPLQPGSRVVVAVAGQVFHLRRAAAEKRALSRYSVDPGLVGAASLAATLVAALVVGVPSTPVGTHVVELGADPVEYLVNVPPPPPKQPKQSADAGAKHKEKEGRSGRTKAKLRDASGNRAELRKQALDREVVERSGLLAAMGAADHVLGSAGLSAELRGGVGGLIGTHGTRYGNGGVGDRGPGFGGGGAAETRGIGLHGPGAGPDLGTKGTGEISTSEREILEVGNLDKALIDEVIKRHLSQIRYCYQHELNRAPELGGKLVVKFTISGDGSVSAASAKSSTLANGAVEQCVVDRFLKMEFPSPKGGGLALVSYPFLFSPG
jgi:hypothetical protein